MKINTGCSSFYNKLWKGIFYPEDLVQSKWFAYYCENFNCFEINSTFYKFPTIKVLDSWYKKSPTSFLYAVKAPREITHYKKLIDCAEQIDNFYQVCEQGLKEKLGRILFQFPPSFKYSEEALNLILNSIKPEFNSVVEFRNATWWNNEVYDAFVKNKIIFCNVNYPHLPEGIIATSDINYIRLHGNPQLFYSSYSSKFLSTLHDSILVNKNIKESYIFFNNTASSAGILNALEFKSL